jgi:hypothetical protein
MTDVAEPSPSTDRARFRRTLAGVLTTQVVVLLLLWLLQARYTD